MTPDDEKRALSLAARAQDSRLAARARATLRERYPDARAQRAEQAEQALRAADAWLYRVQDALAGARLGDDADLVARLEASLDDAKAASDGAAREHDAAQAALSAEVGRAR